MTPNTAGRVLRALMLLAGAATGCAKTPSAQTTRESVAIMPLAPRGVPGTEFPRPDRRVASIVSPSWDNEDDRDRIGEADSVIATLGIRPGMSVADIGAGSGYYTMRVATRIAPRGRVYAEDIVPSYLRDLAARVQKSGAANVTIARGDPDDPRLLPQSVDRALLIHMYHEITQPFGLMYNLYPALRAGALIGIVDLDRPTGSHGTPPAQLRCELAASGYQQVSFRSLPDGYLAVFAPVRHPSPVEIRTSLRQTQC